MTVRSVCLKVRAVPILGRAIQIVIPLNQLQELLLDIGQLLSRELVLVRSHLLKTKEPQEADFVLEQEK